MFRSYRSSLTWLMIGATAGFLTAFAVQSGSNGSVAPAAAQQPAAKAPAGKHDPWLPADIDRKFERIQEHFRGLDMAMVEIGHRYGELLTAVKFKNWAYADYQTKKIRQSLLLAIERRPKREQNSKAFINEDLPPTLEAIAAKDETKLPAALDKLHAGCIRCHKAEKEEGMLEAIERIRLRATR
jgi:hypothetical protein